MTIIWLNILLVGAMISRHAAGVYAAVSKLALVGAFALEGTRLAISPQVSALLARREPHRAAALYQDATRWLMLATWPLYLVFAIFPAVVLGIFGSRYTAGAAALAVLSLAMLVNLGTGNVTVVLLMGGKSSWGAINTGAALIVNIGLNLLLIPHLGILGAAIAMGRQHRRGQRRRHGGVAVGARAGALRPRIRAGRGRDRGLLRRRGPRGARAAGRDTAGARRDTGRRNRGFAVAVYTARAPLRLAGMWAAAFRPRTMAVAANQPRKAA